MKRWLLIFFFFIHYWQWLKFLLLCFEQIVFYLCIFTHSLEIFFIIFNFGENLARLKKISKIFHEFLCFRIWTILQTVSYCASVNDTELWLANSMKCDKMKVKSLFPSIDHAIQTYKPIQCDSWKLKGKSANILAIVIDLIKKKVYIYLSMYTDREILKWISWA